MSTEWLVAWTVGTLTGFGLSFALLSHGQGKSLGYHEWHYLCVSQVGNRDTTLSVPRARMLCYQRERELERVGRWPQRRPTDSKPQPADTWKDPVAGEPT